MSLRSESSNGKKVNRRKTALVCAGGGLTGMMWEVGCLKAINDFLANFSVLDFDIYVGVSAGAYVAACMANRISPDEMYADIVERRRTPRSFSRAPIFQLNTAEFATRLAHTPQICYDALRTIWNNRHSWSLADIFFALGELIPSGIMDNSGTGDYLSRLFTAEGRTDSFDALGRELYIVGTNLDNGEATIFGEQGFTDVPISLAVRASGALPGVWRPVRINGTDYIDGGINKTAHISQAIKHGAGLVVCVNPIVPIFNDPNHSVLRSLNGGRGYISQKGLSYVLDQAFRIVLHSRMKYGLARYAREFPDVEIIVIEPPRDDLKMFLYNILRYSVRVILAEHGFKTARRMFLDHLEDYGKMFARHGIQLSPDLAEHEYRRMCAGVPIHTNRSVASLERSIERLEARLRGAAGVGGSLVEER